MGPDEALIKVRASGICSGDVMPWYIEKKAPLVLGHEPAGEIVEVGPNSIRAMDFGLQCVAPGGTAVFFTPAKPGEKLTIDPDYFRDINIVTSYSCGPDDTRESLELIQRGIVTAQKIVTHRFSIEETETAYRTVAQARDSLKVLVKID